MLDHPAGGSSVKTGILSAPIFGMFDLLDEACKHTFVIHPSCWGVESLSDS